MGEDVPSTLSPNMYHPRQALKNAINDWLPEFSKKRAAWGVIVKPQPCVAPAIPIPIIPSVNTCMSLTSTTTTTSVQAVIPMPVVVTNSTGTATTTTTHLQALAEVCSNATSAETFVPPPGPVMNSLVSETKVVSEFQASPIASVLSTEPMDCNTTPNSSPAHLAKAPPPEDVSMVENTSVRLLSHLFLLLKNNKLIINVFFKDLQWNFG